MSGFSVRKDNIGKAIIRFLIGLLMVAVVVLLLYEVVLKGDYEMADKPVDGSIAITDQTADDPGNKLQIVKSTQKAEATATPTATPTPTPTPEPTPTPTPTPIPQSAFSIRTADNTLSSIRNWKVDLSKIDQNLVKFKVHEDHVLELIGWSYAKDEKFDGENCDIYIIVLDAKNKMNVYIPTVEPGVSGNAHEGKGKNLDKCDFTALVDVSDFADGDYRIGSGIVYKSGNTTRRYCYTFGESYDFTVVDGLITAMGGIENS
ncbi:MAG: hypothetical protein IJC48_04080 [Clostridia bacterium]|nr:hypothetical protein [Clostridia bacterium]